MNTLRIGVTSYEAFKAWTIRIARGEERRAADTPKTYFTSAEAFARLLSVENRALLRMVAEQHPNSIESLAALTGRAPSSLSQTSEELHDYGIVALERHGRRTVPSLLVDRVELVVPITAAGALLAEPKDLAVAEPATADRANSIAGVA